MRKLTPFRMNAGDNTIMEPGAHDLTLWCQYYFDGWTPKWYQHQFHHAPQKDKLFVAGVRTGKSKGVAAGFLHYAYYHPHCRIANASISADQANILYNDIIDFASRPRFQHWIEKDDKHPYPKIRLVNGAEIWFRSIGYEAELWRGHEFDWINVDEAGYVQREMAIKTLKGRLVGAYTVGGQMIHRAGIFTMTTSPRGKGWLFERWKRGDSNYLGCDPSKYFNLRARTRDNDSLSIEQIEDLEAEYSSRMIQQELEGLFLDSEGVVFPYDQIMYACSEEVRPEVGRLHQRLQNWLREHNLTFHSGDLDYYSLDPIPGHVYLNSWDLGKRPTKSGRNAMVGGVFDITARPHELVAWRYAPGASYGVAHEWITEWANKYGGSRGLCETVVDATGKGDVVNERLEEEERLQVDGMVYSAYSKPQLIMAGELAFEKGWVTFPFIRRAVDQLQGYEREDKMLAQDIVMMFCQALYRARQRWGEGAKTKSTEKSIMATGRSRNDTSLDRFRARRQANRAPRSRARR